MRQSWSNIPFIFGGRGGEVLPILVNLYYILVRASLQKVERNLMKITMYASPMPIFTLLSLPS